MKGKFTKISVLMLSSCAMVILSGLATACNGPGIDESKTQLYVKCYQGGYGNKWLYNAKEKYEALHAEDSYQEGKRGVEIIISDQKATPSSSEILNNNSELYFFEGMNYQNKVKDGAFEEITDFVTGVNPYESDKTIESKMMDGFADFLNLKDSSENPHYYAIPHYSSSFGIVYNKSVFKENGFYFVDGYEEETPGTDVRFVQDASEKKSAGPDGVYDTNDDGLPVTYDEFFELVEFIYYVKQIPFVWRGEGNGKDYFGSLLNSLATFYDGAVQSTSYYQMDGEITVAQMKSDLSDVLYNEDGSLKTEKVTVHPEKVNGEYDGYNVQRLAGRYHALNFVKKVMNNKDKWLCNLVTDSSDHIDAQTFFINSQFGRLNAHGDQANKQIAMIFEGAWWESEASTVIASLPDKEKEQLDFGWMPLPQADANSNSNQTMITDTGAYVFLKAGLKDYQRVLAGDFMQYMTTDESLRDFTVTTNAMKGYNYELTADDKAKMSKFGVDLWEFHKTADKVLPESHVVQFTSSLGQQLNSRRYAYSESNFYPQNDFINDVGLTAGQYLARSYKYYKNTIWGGLN